MLAVASQVELNINWKKCRFLQSKVEFLGHQIEGGCLRPASNKVEAVQSFPVPTTIRQVQSFLGLSGYFRKFIPGYSKIARSLTNLLKANTDFHFDDAEKNAFEQLKKILARDFSVVSDRSRDATPYRR